jgi:6-phosphofructokinase 1
MTPTPEDLEVPVLGSCHYPSPLRRRGQQFVDAGQRVLLSPDAEDVGRCLETGVMPPSFERAGPRESLFFDPAGLACGIVTCGGLCPGINDVIRSIVMTLTYGYGVRRVLGFRYGYQGLSAGSPVEPVGLVPDQIDQIHEHGGTMLGSSRGPQPVEEIVSTLDRCKIGILFCIGGDGTMAGASAIAAEIARQGREIGVIGIPKTIDNDLVWIQRSFGFSTAVEEARRAIRAAHVEAKGAWNGVGLVKLMGRHSGFITAHACLANNDANLCLIPEVPFTVDGDGGLLDVLEQRLAEKRHAVVVVAEGAGQELLESGRPERRDASGNVRLEDIGQFLRGELAAGLADRGTGSSVRYIDPSYMIRSLPANAFDSEFCLILGQHAVHAGMAGRTDVVVGFWNSRFTHVPIGIVAGRRRRVEPDGRLWHRVLEATGQPASMGR